MAFIESGKTFDKEENYEKMKKRMDSMDSTSYMFRIPSSLYKKVKIKLASDNKKLKPILVKLLEEYVKE